MWLVATLRELEKRRIAPTKQKALFKNSVGGPGVLSTEKWLLRE